MPLKTIYYVRHGESEDNVAGLTSGSEANPTLTENGRKQAEKAGQDLKGKDIDAIVCSPLIRAKDTATIIAKAIGYDPKQIIESPLFVERSVGIYSLRPYEEYKTAVDTNTLHESVESTEAMHKRVTKGLDWLKTLEGKTIVVVSHGGTGRMVQVIQRNLHHSEIFKVDRFGNTEIYKFELE